MARKDTNKPTVEEIKALEKHLSEEVYSELHRRFAEDETFYELEFKSKLNLPTQYEKNGIVLPTSRDVIDTYVDNIDLANARIQVNKKSATNISAEEAEMMRKFYYGLLYMTDINADISQLRVSGKHVAMHGMGIIKHVWDPDLWGDKPERKRGESEKIYGERIDAWRGETHLSLPIVIQAVHPACAMPDPNNIQPLFIFEKQQKLAYEVRQIWPHWTNPNSREMNTRVEFISYWDKDYRCDLVDGEPVLKIPGGVVKHNYGFIPYVIINSGLGNLSQDAKPEKRYVGILRYLHDLLISESRNFSIYDIVLARTAWPYGFLTGENASQVTEVSMEFGKWNPLPDGVQAVPAVQQVPPDALAQHLYRTSDRLAAYAPRSVRGLGEEGVRAAADRRLIIAQGKARYQYATEAFKYGVAKVLTNCAKLIKNVIPGNVRVWARTPTDEFDIIVDKDKMEEPFTCYVEFAPISEEDEYRRHDDVERLYKSGLVSKRWARTQMSNIDPLATERDEMRERLMNDPNLLGIISQTVAQEAMKALGIQPAPTASPAPMEEPGRRMAPPIPERAIPGSAEDLQNKLKQLRSQTSMTQQGQGGGGMR